MWIKEIRKYDIEVYENNELVYSGKAEEAPDNLKNRETKSMLFNKKRIRIEI